MCVLSGGESEAALLGLEGQEAGQQSLCDLQIVAVESGCCLGDVTELVGEFLLHDGVQLRLVTLQGIKLNKKNACVSISYVHANILSYKILCNFQTRQHSSIKCTYVYFMCCHRKKITPADGSFKCKNRVVYDRRVMTVWSWIR